MKLGKHDRSGAGRRAKLGSKKRKASTKRASTHEQFVAAAILRPPHALCVLLAIISLSLFVLYSTAAATRRNAVLVANSSPGVTSARVVFSLNLSDSSILSLSLSLLFSLAVFLCLEICSDCSTSASIFPTPTVQLRHSLTQLPCIRTVLRPKVGSQFFGTTVTSLSYVFFDAGIAPISTGNIHLSRLLVARQ